MKVYSVFVEHKCSIRSFSKIATTHKNKAEQCYNEMIEYFTNYCKKQGNFSIKELFSDMDISHVACTIIKGAKTEHIIHFNMFEDDD